MSAARVEEIRSGLPEGPAARAARFVEEYGLLDYDAGVLTSTRGMAEYFEAVVEFLGDSKGFGKEAANWVMGAVLKLANELRVDVVVDGPGGPSPLHPADVAAHIAAAAAGKISRTVAKELIVEVPGEHVRYTGHRPQILVQATERLSRRGWGSRPSRSAAWTWWWQMSVPSPFPTPRRTGRPA